MSALVKNNKPLVLEPKAIVRPHPGAIDNDAQLDALLDLILEMSIEHVALEAKNRKDENG